MAGSVGCCAKPAWSQKNLLSIRNKYTEGLCFVILTVPCSINLKLISLAYLFKQTHSAMDVRK